VTEPGLAKLTAAEAARKIAQGELSSGQYVQACLDRIAAADGEIRAFIHLDPAHALAQARQRDEETRAGKTRGPLHGVPVALKDIFDTADYPAENGWKLHVGRKPAKDAETVRRLRAAGAVIIGKTVTTECAYFFPGATRNPHDLARTPGGSSSGSAAAVAAGMVPLALGSQTNGSMIRPAAFCGVIGLKPSHGTIPRTGVFSLSSHLDHVGVFARSLADAALALGVLAGSDAGDPDTWDASTFDWRTAFRGTAEPRLAFVKTPMWEKAEPSTRAAFKGLAARLDEAITAVDLPARFADAWPAQATIMAVEMAQNFGDEAGRGGPEKSSEMLRKILAEGRDTPPAVYRKAVDNIEPLRAMFHDAMKDFDAAVTPATIGAAPLADTTGDPVFCTPWSVTGVPAITLPLLSGEKGLPLGVQLIAKKGDDARLLRAAEWLWRKLKP
jgi:Asp-tRNA(Asn)/Glu-tRNA(Gln) amidotransferase A subunit family amidase